MSQCRESCAESICLWRAIGKVMLTISRHLSDHLVDTVLSVGCRTAFDS